MELTSSKIKSVFIAGITTRTGTNYLGRILMCNPEFTRHDNHWEVPFLLSSNEYLKFVEHFKGQRRQERLEYIVPLLPKMFGDLLLNFLYPKNEFPSLNKILVFKNPDVTNLRNFPRFFPESKLIILLREGHDVVNSLISAAGYKGKYFSINRYLLIKKYAKRFASAAKEIIYYKENIDPNVLILRFEDMNNNTSLVIDKISEYLGVENNPEWHLLAKELPVKGTNFSDNLLEINDSNTDWRELKKTDDFKPIGRYKDYFNWLDLLIFNLIAKKANKDLGY